MNCQLLDTLFVCFIYRTPRVAAFRSLADALAKGAVAPLAKTESFRFWKKLTSVNLFFLIFHIPTAENSKTCGKLCGNCVKLDFQGLAFAQWVVENSWVAQKARFFWLFLSNSDFQSKNFSRHLRLPNPF